MELRHLRYFVAAAEEEHFGRASERMHVTRPAVSQIIADLEAELGITLFERLAQRVKLTAAGRALLPQVQAIIADLNQAVVMARRVGEGKTGALTIGYGSLTLLHPLFRAAIKQFHESCPDVTLSLLEIGTSRQAKALAEGRIHAGFMHLAPEAVPARRSRVTGDAAEGEPALERLRIQACGLGVVMPSEHPLARRKRLAIGDLAAEPFVVVSQSSVSVGYGLLFSLCQQAGFEPRVTQEVASVATLLNLVSVGVGIGLAVTGKGFSYPAGVKVVALEGVNYASTFALCWLKGPTEPVLDRFVQVVRELAQARAAG
jgi:DNA-binding transcriptional LysR family regulator